MIIETTSNVLISLMGTVDCAVCGDLFAYVGVEGGKSERPQFVIIATIVDIIVIGANII